MSVIRSDQLRGDESAPSYDTGGATHYLKKSSSFGPSYAVATTDREINNLKGEGWKDLGNGFDAAKEAIGGIKAALSGLDEGRSVDNQNRWR